MKGLKRFEIIAEFFNSKVSYLKAAICITRNMILIKDTCGNLKKGSEEIEEI